CDLLIFGGFYIEQIKSKIKRSQPSAAPTGVLVDAKAVCQPTSILNVPASSRASPAPTGD
ncbi:hypothetical protein M4Z12_00385, partial [Pseudomonas sp. In614]|nr:hypothetical protein [Pseudomonas nunensis]